MTRLAHNQKPNVRFYEARYLTDNGLVIDKFESLINAEQKAEDLIRDGDADSVGIYVTEYENTFQKRIIPKRRY